MTLEFPAALFALLALPAFWLLARRGIAPSGTLGLRMAVFSLIVFALARPIIWVESKERHVTWVADLSRSAGKVAAETAARFAAASGIPAADQSTVYFAGRAGSADAENFPGMDTNIARALQYAAASTPPGKAAELVLFTDGAETDGDAVSAARALAAGGARISVVPVERPKIGDARVISLELPPQIRAREPFGAEAVVAADSAARADLEWTVDGLRAASESVDLVPGCQTFRSTHTLPGGGSAKIGFHIRAQNDPIPENDAIETVALAGGESSVLIVSTARRSPLAAALASQGIRAEVRPPEGMPTTREGYAAFEAVLLDGVPASAIPAESADALVSAVKEGGCGLLLSGGAESFGAGGYAGTEIGHLLPLTTDFENERENPTLALVSVIDRSGSMKGEKLDMAKSAARAAFAVLSPQDYAGLVAFDIAAVWAIPLEPAGEAQAGNAKIDALAAGGGTNISAGLQLALGGLRPSTAKLRHIILLSDGISMPGPFEAIVSDLAASGITLSTVGLGGEADTALLEALARDGGGRFYFTDSPDTIPQIFAKDAMLAGRPPVIEEPFEPSIARKPPFLDPSLAFPPLLGFSLARAKPGADVWLEASGGRPLLATWRAGLAKTAAFTSDTGKAWASEWVRWPGYGKFWAGVLREIFRPAELGGNRLSVKRSGDTLVATLEVVGEDGRPVAGVSASARFGEGAAVAMEPVGPGLFAANLHRSRREEGVGGIPDPYDGAGLVVAEIKVPGKSPRTVSAPAASIYPEELLFRPARDGFFEELASEGGGSVNPAASDITSWEMPPVRHPLELWPWALAAAALAFVGDVAARRLRARA